MFPFPLGAASFWPLGAGAAWKKIPGAGAGAAWEKNRIRSRMEKMQEPEKLPGSSALVLVFGGENMHR